MKIRTDFSEIVPKRAMENKISIGSSSRLRNSPQNELIDHQLQRAIIAKFNREKTLGDALSIAQMSHSILQSALVISLRLSRIASEAISTGKVNKNELNEAVSDIKTSIENYTESISFSTPSFTNFSANTPDVIPVNNDPGDELNAVIDIVDNMRNDINPKLEEINILAEKINKKSVVIEKTIDKIKDSMGEVLSELPGGVDKNFSFQESNIIDSIRDAPAKALFSQGNISHDTARSLFINVSTPK